MKHLLLMQEVFEDVAAGRPRQGWHRARGKEQDLGSQAAALASVAAFWCGEFPQATSDATRARSTAIHLEDHALAAAASALASAGEASPCHDDPVRASTDIVLEHFADDAWWSGVQYLSVEAALMCAQLATAARITTFASGPASGWDGHPFGTVMTVCAVRLAAFRGYLGDAAELMAVARQAASSRRLEDLTEALDYMVLNHSSALPSTMTREGSTFRARSVEDLLERGVVFLMAYGAQAAGNRSDAARAIFRAGGDSRLSGCTLIDRALGFELLLMAALADNDQTAADAWLHELLSLEGGGICRPSVDRALARYALSAGDYPTATVLCTRSIDDCRRQERAIEAAEGELLLAQVNIASSDVATATRRLRSLVEHADRQGHGAVRRSAGATLATVNRRLPPIAGLGWAALTPREAEVAHLIIQGLAVAEMATHMSLSVRTVRGYVSRILCAFNVSTRVGLLASVGPGPLEDLRVSRNTARLTPRQMEVVGLIAQDLSNIQISSRLGVAPRTVEKHISDILQRLDGTSRFDIARFWWSAQSGKQQA